jgi:hypothetical protein
VLATLLIVRHAAVRNRNSISKNQLSKCIAPLVKTGTLAEKMYSDFGLMIIWIRSDFLASRPTVHRDFFRSAMRFAIKKALPPRYSVQQHFGQPAKNTNLLTRPAKVRSF